MDEILLNSDNFKCSRCKKHLSVAPILALENEEYICGRCEDFIYEENSNPKTERQTLYEKLAQHVGFPCCYANKGCLVTLKWNEVEEHEKRCEFNTINYIGCLFNAKEFNGTPDCKWKGTEKEYFKHLEETHSETVENIQKLDIWTNPKSQVFRIELLHNIMLVFLLFFENAYHFVVVGKNKKSTIEYTLEISDETAKNFCMFTQLTTFLPLSIDEIREYRLNFNPRFLIVKYFSVHFKNGNKCNENCDAISLPLCQYCQRSLSFPFYQCSGSHRVCRKCFPGYNKTCRRGHCTWFCKITEFETSLIKNHYKCGTKGCSYHGDLYAVMSHSEICKEKTDNSLPFSKLNSAYEMDVADNFFEFDDSIFKLSKTDNEETFTFRVFWFESTNIKYKFEIFVFNSKMSLSFSIIPDFSKTMDSCIEIPKILLDEIEYENTVERKNEKNDKFKFKLNISKIKIDVSS